MRTGLISATLAVAASVTALPSPPTLGNVVNGVTNAVAGVIEQVCEALPAEAFKTEFSHTPVPIEEAKIKLLNYKIKYPISSDANTPSAADSGSFHPYKANTPPAADPDSFHPYKANSLQSGAKCANLRIRVEWDRMSDSDKQKYVDALKCLLSRRPSGQFPQAQNRYEDIVALHQTLTPNVHGNDKFLLWHRALVHLFDRTLRNECAWDGPMPWFDETRYAGRFAQNSFFSSKWFGGIALNNRCVADGQFPNLALHVGPGDSNTLHCLSRNGNGQQTAGCSAEYYGICHRYPDYSGLCRCIELGPHASGHNGVGGPMSDVQASPSDFFFWMHHGMVDRSLRLWTNQNPQWLNQINGVDRNGNPLTLDTVISTAGMMPDLRIRDILDTTGPTLCYKYDY